MKRNVRNRWLVAPLAASLLVFGACEDDSTGIEDDHLEAYGFALYEAETETLLYDYMLEDGTPTTLEIPVGVHEVVIVLLDESGNSLPEEAGHDHDHVLEVNSSDPSILTWTPEDHDHAHDFIEFHGELSALQTGSVTVEICVPHDDHCDFDADVPVTVVPAT